MRSMKSTKSRKQDIHELRVINTLVIITVCQIVFL